MEGSTDAPARSRRSTHRHSCGQPELPGHPDRAGQVPVQAASALRARLRVFRSGRGAGRGRHSPEGRRCRGGDGLHRRLRHACRCRRQDRAEAAAGLRIGGRCRLRIDLRHLAPCTDRPRGVEVRRDRAGARRGRRRRNLGDPGGQGHGSEGHRRRLHRREMRVLPRGSAPMPRSTTPRKTCATR